MPSLNECGLPKRPGKYNGQPFRTPKDPALPMAAQNSFLPYGKIIDFQLIYHPCYNWVIPAAVVMNDTVTSAPQTAVANLMGNTRDFSIYIMN